jgi:hypothetical protein
MDLEEQIKEAMNAPMTQGLILYLGYVEYRIGMCRDIFVDCVREWVEAGKPEPAEDAWGLLLVQFNRRFQK